MLKKIEIQRNSGLELLERALTQITSSGTLHLPDGETRDIGTDAKEWVWRILEWQALDKVNQYKLAQDFVRGRHEVEGNLAAAIEVRNHLPVGLTPWLAATLGFQFFTSVGRRGDRSSIDRHYSAPDELFLTFLDRNYRLYSHGLFPGQVDDLEHGSERKLQQVFDLLNLRPGSRVLDIGGGWGGFSQFCHDKGVDVTTLTLGHESFDYLRQNGPNRRTDNSVHLVNFLDYRDTYRFDAIAILGVLEHIPRYGAFCDQVLTNLKPGGRLYIDAAAARHRLSVSPFSRKHTWVGNHTFISLADIIRELQWRNFALREVVDETRDYGYTMRLWAERLEDASEMIKMSWGESTFNMMRIYLRGGEQAMLSRRLQAYHILAIAPEGAAPRSPQRALRALDWVASRVQNGSPIHRRWRND